MLLCNYVEKTQIQLLRCFCIDKLIDRLIQKVLFLHCYHIFSKLPLKSIKRFSCARKSWSRLFENHSFINMFIFNSHLLYHDACLNLIQSPKFPNSHVLNNFYLLSDDKFQNKLKLKFPPPFLDPQFSIIQILDCVNGILCIISKTVVVFWNLLMRKLRSFLLLNLSFPVELWIMDLTMTMLGMTISSSNMWMLWSVMTLYGRYIV